jgi:hypothetical protein
MGKNICKIWGVEQPFFLATKSRKTFKKHKCSAISAFGPKKFRFEVYRFFKYFQILKKNYK